MTEDWWDHSASDNLFVRKMHYEEKRSAAYSFWPEQGWDGMFQDLADAVTENGGEIRLGESVARVVIENHEVKGVTVARDAAHPPERLRVRDDRGRLRRSRRCPSGTCSRSCRSGSCRTGTWGRSSTSRRTASASPGSASTSPSTSRCRCSTGSSSRRGCTRRRRASPGFFFEQTALDPTTAPAGKYLYVTGGIIPGAKGRDERYVTQKFDEFEHDIGVMYPGLAKPSWRRRHLVFEPSFGVIQKPGLVGMYRPHWRAPNVDGLYFASETFRSRGIGVDRASRAGLTVVEDILARRLPGFEETWRY